LDESVFLLLYHHSYLIAYLAGIILNNVTRSVAAATGSNSNPSLFLLHEYLLSVAMLL
jgi:hypothetical protein